MRQVKLKNPTAIINTFDDYNKYECTVDQELAYAAAQAHGRCFFIHQLAALFCIK